MNVEQGWIEWNGGECPVPDNTLIEAETSDGARYEGLSSSFFRGRWEHSGYIPSGGHIIAYRIVEPGK